MNTEHFCFCDLAPIYALNQLSEPEKAWVEQQVATCPELAEELASYESALTAIPYSLPPLPIPSQLKQQLFERLDLEPPAGKPAPNLLTSPQSPDCWAVRSQDLDWQPHDVPGVMIAIVHTDEVKREWVGFLKADPGVRYPLHRHAATEEMFMLSGDLVIGEEVFEAGDYIRSLPGSAHAPYTKGGCRFFFHTSMDDQALTTDLIDGDVNRDRALDQA